MPAPWIAKPVVVVALVVCAAFTLSGCGVAFDDPTELNFYVKVINDTPRDVVLSSCGTNHNLCDGKLYGTETLKPGTEDVAEQTSVGASNPMLVRSLSGKRLGCLPLYFDYNASGAVVRVSELVPCQEHYAAQSKPTR